MHRRVLPMIFAPRVRFESQRTDLGCAFHQLVEMDTSAFHRQVAGEGRPSRLQTGLWSPDAVHNLGLLPRFGPSLSALCVDYTNNLSNPEQVRPVARWSSSTSTSRHILRAPAFSVVYQHATFEQLSAATVRPDFARCYTKPYHNVDNPISREIGGGSDRRSQPSSRIRRSGCGRDASFRRGSGRSRPSVNDPASTEKVQSRRILGYVPVMRVSRWPTLRFTVES